MTTTIHRWPVGQQPTTVVRNHLVWLLTQGTARDAITTRTGVCDRTIRSVLAGTTTHVRAGTAAALLAARPAAATKGLVPAVGTIRRLRALIAFGYSIRHLAAVTGLARTGVSRLSNRGQQQVDVNTRHRVADVYERLSATPGPSDETRRLGRIRGWALPAAWDDIDSPDEQPCPPAISDPRTLINRVLFGNAHIDLLTTGQQTGLWHRWAERRRAAGLAVNARQFAIQFEICERRARRIAAEATFTPTDSIRTDRKVA